MVMEAATLSSPQRKHDVTSVQKSLSLPSYARAGGEGIDHRLIFAALEQKERVRRKSKIFTREKTSRQNIFCLPISTGSKCRETDLSSDTSCSSLEYQKPKPSSKPKKEALKQEANDNDTKSNELKSNKAIARSIVKQTETFKETISKSSADYGTLNHNILNGSGSFKINEHSKGYRSPIDTLRLNVGSSDSMERSSRSSNDSLTRKERLVAIKARVEAEREKYGNSSSEEDTRSNLTRYNSDGGIHRTVRDVKSRSYRNEKRLRRRSHGEWAIKKTDRKNNLSLCLNPEDDGIKLHLEKINRLNNEINNLEVKTDFCPSPNVPDNSKKNYFSDFPTKENLARFVQQRIRHIEEEEHKRRSGSDFFDKVKSSQFGSLSQEKSTSVEHVNLFEKKTPLSSLILDNRFGSSDLSQRSSPVPRAKEAPTPPPRSPKSIAIVNKTFLHHQNTTHSNIGNESDKKGVFQPNISSLVQTKSSEKSSPKFEVRTRVTANSFQSHNNPAEARELFNARRKTCSNFDFVDEKVLNDLCSVLGTNSTSNLTTNSNHSGSLNQIRNIDNNNYSSNPETSPSIVLSNQNKSPVSKWEENERKREFLFNSLENKKSSSSLSWSKWKVPFDKEEKCICHLSPGNKYICKSKLHDLKSNSNTPVNTNSSDNVFKIAKSKIFPGNSHEKWKLPSENKTACNSYLAPQSKMENSLKQQTNNSAMDEDLTIQLIDLENNLKLANKSKASNGNNVSANVVKSTKFDVSYPSEYRHVNGKPSFDTKHSNEDLSCQVNNSSATANLDSAMAELENVYLSLKLSSDNLSERNSLSNISLSDEEAKIFTQKSTNLSKNKDLPLKRLSIQESNTYFNDINFSLNGEKLKNGNSISKNENSSSIRADVSSENVQLKDNSINELFRDLMPQLDTVEQKLRSHDNPCLQLTSSQQENIFDNNSTDKNSCSIKLKKEFYENLNVQKGNFQRKRLAAQTLSENISHLMSTPPSTPISKNMPEIRPQLVHSNSANSSPSNSYKSSKTDSLKSDYKPELSYLCSGKSIKSNQSVRPFSPCREEIRQVRVSMDTSQPKYKPCDSFVEANKYSRLSSAVNSPHMSPKCDVTKPFTFTTASSTNDGVDKTIDGLEELLNSLLVDVPDSKQSSLPKTKEPVSTTSPISAGEMCVMQHLDIIRLKPVPS